MRFIGTVLRLSCVIFPFHKDLVDPFKTYFQVPPRLIPLFLGLVNIYKLRLKNSFRHF